MIFDKNSLSKLVKIGKEILFFSLMTWDQSCSAGKKGKNTIKSFLVQVYQPSEFKQNLRRNILKNRFRFRQHDTGAELWLDRQADAL